MKIDDTIVDHISHLARLEFNGNEKEEIKKDLSNIIGFIDQLNEVDTEGVEPLVFMSDAINVLRADVSRVSITQEQALKNAPNHDSDYFKIAKVLKQQ
jgi:aspartyl-tRNA(Asn)/glutamyl-tRNA(Gln) amidotransferase subunit C